MLATRRIPITEMAVKRCRDQSCCSRSYLSLRLIPLVRMSRFFVIRRLASSAEPANSKRDCVGEEFGDVDDDCGAPDTLACISSFYIRTCKQRITTTSMTLMNTSIPKLQGSTLTLAFNYINL